VQGTAADIMKKALVLLSRRINGTGAIMVGFVHDEIVVEAPTVMEDEIYEILKRTMEDAGRFFLKAVPVVADVVIARSWADK